MDIAVDTPWPLAFSVSASSADMPPERDVTPAGPIPKASNVHVVRNALRPAPAAAPDPLTLGEVLLLIDSAETTEALAATREYVDALADDDERKQAAKALAQINRFDSQKNAQAAGEVKHG
jgi:16S rRNA C1402 (ribose-2'-O) methylase RsmI